jgi:hypothetical protein
VNPLAFLCANVLRRNAALVRVRAEGVDPAAPGWGFLRVLRKLVRPQASLIVLVERAHADAPVVMDGPGGESRAGYAEAASPGYGTAVAEAVSAASAAEAVTLRYAGPACS